MINALRLRLTIEQIVMNAGRIAGTDRRGHRRNQSSPQIGDGAIVIFKDMITAAICGDLGPSRKSAKPGFGFTRRCSRDGWRYPVPGLRVECRREQKAPHGSGGALSRLWRSEHWPRRCGGRRLVRQAVAMRRPGQALARPIVTLRRSEARCNRRRPTATPNPRPCPY
jgi:hypothetical protein